MGLRGVLLGLLVALVVARLAGPAPPRGANGKTVINKIHSRKIAASSDKLLPPHYVELSPSPSPKSVEVDPRTIELGNDIVHRVFMDYPEHLQVIMPEMQFDTEGRITSWELYTGRDCVVSAQVFRPAPTPMPLIDNIETVHAFSIVGENTLFVPGMGHHHFDIEAEYQIQVQHGDVIGFYSPGAGCVSYSDGGIDRVLYRYGAPTRTEVKSFDGVVAIGEGLLRTYSILCSGKFNPDVVLAENPRISPSVTPTPTPPSSTSPMPSPHSPTPSMTPILSKSPSFTPSPSPSWSPIAPSPSVTPSITPVWELYCSYGFEFVCQTLELIHMCNLTVESCNVGLEAMGLPIPDAIKLAGYETMIPDRSLFANFSSIRAAHIPERPKFPSTPPEMPELVVPAASVPVVSNMTNSSKIRARMVGNDRRAASDAAREIVLRGEEGEEEDADAMFND